MSAVVVIGQFRLAAERLDAAREPMARVIAATRAEPGCVKYAYAADPADPALFHVSEVWESQAALDAHFETAHMKRWQEERAAFGLSDRAITVYSVSGSRQL